MIIHHPSLSLYIQWLFIIRPCPWIYHDYSSSVLVPVYIMIIHHPSLSLYISWLFIIRPSPCIYHDYSSSVLVSVYIMIIHHPSLSLYISWLFVVVITVLRIRISWLRNILTSWIWIRIQVAKFANTIFCSQNLNLSCWTKRDFQKFPHSSSSFRKTEKK